MGLLDFFKGGMGGGAPGGGGGMLGAGAGFMSGLNNQAQAMLLGQTPQLNVTPGAVTPGTGVVGPDGMPSQTLRQMPQIHDTGQMGGGLLDKIKAPDSRGLTFGDKLFAAGSVLQGDSGGAATYIGNQRAAADALNERTRSRDMAKRGASAFKNNMSPMGELNMRGYLEEMGDEFDPMAAMKMQDMARPDLTAMSGPRGSLYGFNKRTGAFTEGVAPGPEKESMFNEDGSINWNFIRGQSALAGGKAEAVAPFRAKPRPRAAPTTTGRPPGY